MKISIERSSGERVYVNQLLPIVLDVAERNWELVCQERYPRGFPDLHAHDKERIMRDYRTVRFDIGSRSGKSAAISSLAEKHDLVIVQTDAEKTLFRGEMTLKCPIISQKEMVRGNGLAKYYRRIWVSEASWFTNSNSHLPELICDTLLELDRIKPSDAFPLIILLG